MNIFCSEILDAIKSLNEFNFILLLNRLNVIEFRRLLLRFVIIFFFFIYVLFFVVTILLLILVESSGLDGLQIVISNLLFLSFSDRFQI